jgi:N-sulfoglucosamine sulfohydrolase
VGYDYKFNSGFCKKNIFLNTFMNEVGMKRRSFLKGTAASLIAGTTVQAKVGDDRPNVLFCISDDQSWPHAGAYGDPVVKTPTFDKVARKGILFTNAFCSSPSCTPSRGAILTGQDFHRLEKGGSLWGSLDKKFAVYPEILEKVGYRTGFKPKGWGPGDLEDARRSRNPAGVSARDFSAFLDSTPKDQPFCYWWGTSDPHRPYEPGTGRKSGMDIDKVRVPGFFPDNSIVRSDILDYYFEIERFDREFGKIMEQLEKSGRADNTIVVMTSDNGMPFPRAKANLYEYGTHMPLAVKWPAQVANGRVVDDFISFADFAPTFLEACGLEPLPEMSGRSFLNVLQSNAGGRVDRSRNRVFTGRERHCPCRIGGVGYPMRAIRTDDYMYIWNIEPDRWPAGHPDMVELPAMRYFGDIDPSPTKDYMMAAADTREGEHLFKLAMGKRPEEELYDAKKDPDNLHNLAAEPAYRQVREKLQKELKNWMRTSGDPRAHGSDGGWDHQEYLWGAKKKTPK